MENIVSENTDGLGQWLEGFSESEESGPTGRELAAERARKRRNMLRRRRYRPTKLKNQKRRQNARYWKRRRARIDAERKRNGDIRGHYRVVLFRDRVQVGELRYSKWLSRARKVFDDYVAEHNDGVICEKLCTRDNGKGTVTPFTDEVLLLRLVDPSEDDGVRSFRDADGMFVDHVVANNRKYAIIAKSAVYTPETFQVYGHSPINDRKTGRWIYDEYLAPASGKASYRTVYLLNNKVMIQWDGDFGLVICKTREDGARLYEGLRLEADRLKNRWVCFAGSPSGATKSRLYDTIQEKTGWPRSLLTVAHT